VRRKSLSRDKSGTAERHLVHISNSDCWKKRNGYEVGVVKGKERKKMSLKIGWLRTERNGRSRKIRVSKWCYSVQKIKYAKRNSLFFFFIFRHIFRPLCYYDPIGVTRFRVIKMKNKFCYFHSLTSQWIATVVLKQKDIEIFGVETHHSPGWGRTVPLSFYCDIFKFLTYNLERYISPFFVMT